MSEMEWEDVNSGEGSEDNEVLCEDEQLLQLALGGQLESEGKGKGRGRSITKQDRARAALVHRASAVCLAARCKALESIACSVEVQALIFSHVNLSLLQYLNPQFEQQRAANCLAPVLKWFLSHWRYQLQQDLEAHPGQQEQQPSLQEQVLAAASAGGTQQGVCNPEVAVVLFVALLRAAGYTARVARLLDVSPLTPWKAVSTAPKRQPTPRGVKTAKAGAAIASSKNDGSTVKGGKADTKSRPAKRQKKGYPSAGPSTQRGSEEEGVQKTSSTDDTRNPTVPNHMDAKEGQEAGHKRKGDEEFEAQLRMAMLATEAEERARKEAATQHVSTAVTQGDSIDAHGKASASKSNAGVANLRKQLSGHRHSRSGGLRGGDGASTSRAATGPMLFQATPDFHLCWAEVWCGSSEYGRWVHVDVIGDQVDKADQVAVAAAAAGGYVAASGYIIACEGGIIRDVTARYLQNTLAVKKVRDNEWWETTIRGWQTICPIPTQHTLAGHVQAVGAVDIASGSNGPLPGNQQAVASTSTGPRGDTPSLFKATEACIDLSKSEAGLKSPDATASTVHLSRAATGDDKVLRELREKREAAELAHKEKAGLVGLPTSVEGFQNHPLYVLKRHIGKYQALLPSTQALGLHKGEPYYARDAMVELCSAERWRRQCRQVRESELPNPAKVVKKRKQPELRSYGGGRAAMYSGRAAGSRKESLPDPLEPNEEEGEGANEPQVNLYGIWQTEPFLARAENGKVPKNERGNVEVPPFAAALPIGCVHLQYPALAPICRKLNIDFAPALVGFEIQGGRSVPKIDGVVVCQEFESQVLDAYVQRETAKQEAARVRFESEMRAAWLHLIRAMHMRMQLAGDYGEPQDDHIENNTRETNTPQVQGSRKKKRKTDTSVENTSAMHKEAREQIMQRLLSETQADQQRHTTDQAAPNQQDLDEEEI